MTWRVFSSAYDWRVPDLLQNMTRPEDDMTLELPVLLTLDQGTTSSRTLAFDARGRMLASSQKSIAQSYPRPGWVEEDPEEIFVSQLDTLL